MQWILAVELPDEAARLRNGTQAYLNRVAVGSLFDDVNGSRMSLRGELDPPSRTLSNSKAGQTRETR